MSKGIIDLMYMYVHNTLGTEDGCPLLSGKAGLTDPL